MLALPKPERRGRAPKKRIARKRKGKRAGLARQCDALAGRIVRQSGTTCEDCGRKRGRVLQWAHGFSRRYRATRWLLINGFRLCSGCHFKYGLRPLEWDEWLRRRWGVSVYDELRRVALQNEKQDLADVLLRLQSEATRRGL